MRYKIITNIEYELDSEKELYKKDVVEQLEKMLSKSFDCKILKFSNIKVNKQKEIIGKFELEEIFSIVQDKEKTLLINKNDEVYEIKNSKRYALFRDNPNCCVCGVKAEYFLLEKHYNDVSPHLNLYALNKKKQEVLITKDHIVPKSKGGSNTIENYQTMCYECNNIKGSDDFTHDNIRHLKKIISDNKKIMGRKSLAKILRDAKKELKSRQS